MLGSHRYLNSLDWHRQLQIVVQPFVQNSRFLPKRIIFGLLLFIVMELMLLAEELFIV
jgi:hypothetical protein